jgi:hypothetical protein
MKILTNNSKYFYYDLINDCYCNLFALKKSPVYKEDFHLTNW